MNLYQIGSEWQHLMDAIDAADGELDGALEEALAAVDLADVAKVDAYCRIMRNLHASALARTAEATRLFDLANADEAAVSRMKARLFDHLRRTGLDRLETALFKLAICKNSQPSVAFLGDPLEDLPPWARRVTVEANKKALAEAWAAGEPLPPGVTVEFGSHLRIR